MTRTTSTAAGLAFACCLATAPAFAAGYAYTALNVPQAIDTEPSGINAAGKVVGTYTDPGFGQHGFLYDPASGAFTTIDAPIANGGTIVHGIDNKGRIYGYCFPSAGGVQDFILTSSGFHLIHYKLNGTYYYLQGASDTGLLVAGFFESIDSSYGFVQQFGHKITPLQYQGNPSTANGVNASGLVVGYYTAFSNGSTHAFTYQNGTYASLTYPGAGDTILLGVNDLGQMVGIRAAASPYTNTRHGFLYVNGAFTDLPDPPGTTYGTFPTDINNSGVIVGYAKTQPGSHVFGGGFILTPTP